jgi:hypothetical protein
MFNAVLFTIAKTYNQPRSSSADELKGWRNGSSGRMLA